MWWWPSGSRGSPRRPTRLRRLRWATQRLRKVREAWRKRAPAANGWSCLHRSSRRPLLACRSDWRWVGLRARVRCQSSAAVAFGCGNLVAVVEPAQRVAAGGFVGAGVEGGGDGAGDAAFR